MAQILYGKPVKEKIKKELLERVLKLGVKPCLAVVQVGDREDSNVYIRQKIKFGEEIGVEVSVQKFPAEIGGEELLEQIKKLNEDKRVNGIIVQLPLPEYIDKEKVVATIRKEKDADGLISPHVMPATARGVMALLDFYNIEVKGEKAAVIGRSRLAGGPIAKALTSRGSIVTVCHRQTENMAAVCRAADILISAAGQAGLVTKEFVKEGQVVVDVGINRTSPHLSPDFVSALSSTEAREGKQTITLVGDVMFDEVEPMVAAITPVPGGIGPLTVACLFWNLVDLTSPGFRATLSSSEERED